MITQKQYLAESGVLEHGSLEDIMLAKKEYRKLYLKHKKQQYRKSHKTFTLSFPHSHIAPLTAAAAVHNMPLHHYLKECIYSYHHKVYIVPNEQQVQDLDIALRRIGNNVNQITRLCHQREVDAKTAIAEVQEQLSNLDKRFSKIFREPWDMETFLSQRIEKDPRIVETLMRLMSGYINTKPHAHKDAETQE